ncbi:mucin TcMUCII [Trypanosoma cruzi cruzi]|nr:mucin TcMUCII [Trypanosoma cruzi cruzi]
MMMTCRLLCACWCLPCAAARPCVQRKLPLLPRRPRRRPQQNHLLRPRQPRQNHQPRPPPYNTGTKHYDSTQAPSTTTTEAPAVSTTRAPSRLREIDGSLSSSAWVCSPLVLAASALAYATVG